MLKSVVGIYREGRVEQAAAEYVCGGGAVAEQDVLDLLLQLVNKSLVQTEELTGEVRYRLLETVRQYARDRLLESGEAERMRDRHLDYFLRLAEEAEPALAGAEDRERLSRLEAENANLRVALEWGAGSAGAETSLRLAGALRWFWAVQGPWSEGRAWLEQALGRWTPAVVMTQAGAPSRVAALAHAKALVGAGMMAVSQDDLSPAKEFMQRSLAASRAADEPTGIAECLTALGAAAYRQGAHDEAAQFCEEGLAIFRQTGNGWRASGALGILGIVATLKGESERAEALLGEALAISRDLGNRYGVAAALTGLGIVRTFRGAHIRALPTLQQGLTANLAVGNKAAAARCVAHLAVVAHAADQPEQAARLHGAAEALHEDVAGLLSPELRSAYERSRAAVQEFLGEAAFAQARQAGLALTPEQIETEAAQLAIPLPRERVPATAVGAA
jgi:non-specific serine/threonine protein kinase